MWVRILLACLAVVACGRPTLAPAATGGTTAQTLVVTSAGERVPPPPASPQSSGGSQLVASSAGVEALLDRLHLKLDANTQQLILVVAASWTQSEAQLYRFERASGAAAFRGLGEPWSVRLGHSGLGTGLGLHGPEFAAPDVKHEGDGRSPAGVFRLGTAFGPSANNPVPGSRWPWRQAQAGDVFVDDPKSAAYNQWRIETQAHDWTSREDLTQYELGIVVEHNGERVSDRGSAIFIHSLPRWRATIGCTGMQLKHLHALLAWLAPEQHPLLVQVAGTLSAWAQPGMPTE